MKIAFISDIHGNAVALETVLEDIAAKRADMIFVLGDICYRGPEPRRSLDLVRSLNTKVIKGNADEWVVRGVKQGEVPDKMLETMNREREWTLSKLDQQDIEYLRELPTTFIYNPTGGASAIHAFHATPESLFEVVLPDTPADTLHNKLMTAENASLYVYAHIHNPYVRYLQGKCVVNIGSVGLPFDGLAKASYSIVEVEDDGRYRVTIERVPYDVEKVVNQYEALDYPNAEMMTQIVRTGRFPKL